MRQAEIMNRKVRNTKRKIYKKKQKKGQYEKMRHMLYICRLQSKNSHQNNITKH